MWERLTETASELVLFDYKDGRGMVLRYWLPWSECSYCEWLIPGTADCGI